MQYSVLTEEYANSIPNNAKKIQWLIKNPIVVLPPSVTHLTFGYSYDQPTPLPNSITHLTFGDGYNQATPLPNSIKHLTFGYEYNQATPLPNSITHLTFGYEYNQATPLPNSITHLTFGEHYNQNTLLPNSITHLTFGYFYNQCTSIPNSVTHLTLSENFRRTLLFSENIVNINFGKLFRIRGYNNLSIDDKLNVLMYYNYKNIFDEKIFELLNNKAKLTQKHLYICMSNNDKNNVNLCLNNGCHLDLNCLIIACNQKNTKMIDKCLEENIEMDEECIYDVTQNIYSSKKPKEYPFNATEKNFIKHVTKSLLYKMSKCEKKEAEKCKRFYRKKYNEK